jgi:endonuclease/exonuclease/phosphatase family metal-dependent hydrolase
MTYNILVGGRARGTPDREKLVLSVIARSRPDVLALQEAAGFPPEEGDGLARYAARLGMTGIVGRAGSGLHVALLARPELALELVAHDGHGFRHAALAGRIRLDSHRSLALLVAHLDPFDEDARLAEAGRLLDMVGIAAPGLVLGDFNGLSPADTLDPEHVARLLPQYRARGTDVECRGVGRLLAGGLVDLAQALSGADRSPTYPTARDPHPEGPPIRIDYVMATPPAAGWARRYKVVRTEVSDRASDHYPVACDLETA